MNSKTVGPANPDRSNVESEAQEVILEKSRTLAPLCQPLTTSAPRPAAVMEILVEVLGPRVASVCAYHDGGRGKGEADFWCKERGYSVTHGCCKDCAKLLLDGTWEDLRPKAAIEESKLREFKNRKALAVYCSRIDGDTGRLLQLGQLDAEETAAAKLHNA